MLGEERNVQMIELVHPGGRMALHLGLCQRDQPHRQLKALRVEAVPTHRGHEPNLTTETTAMLTTSGARISQHNTMGVVPHT